MIKVSIDGTEKIDQEIDERWINQQINKRNVEGITPCVRVSIFENGVDLVLSSKSCKGTSSGEANFTIRQKRIIDLWTKNHLDKDEFSGGNLNAFLKQMRSLL